MTEMRSQPERYGTDFSDIKPPPMLAHAAAKYVDGWIITVRAEARQAAA